MCKRAIATLFKYQEYIKVSIYAAMSVVIISGIYSYLTNVRSILVSPIYQMDGAIAQEMVFFVWIYSPTIRPIIVTPLLNPCPIRILINATNTLNLERKTMQVF